MGKIKRLFINLPLRRTIAVYITVFAMAAVFMSAVTSCLCQIASCRIYNSYPPSGERYYLTTEDGKHLGSGAYIQADADERVITPRDERLLTLLDLLPVVCPPLYSALCVAAAAMLFYHSKLKTPLALLEEGSRKISDNELDFTICYRSKDELGQLCASFETMRAALSANFSEMFRQMEERKRLNAAFAHDLRTPLTVLKGYTEMLMEERDGAVKETAGVMSKHLLRLERYADSMSSVRRLEDRKLACQSVCLPELAVSLKRSAVLYCSRSKKQLIFNEAVGSTKLFIDPEAIQQILDNLLSNAVRYANNRIFISFEEEENGLLLSVTDDGPGFTDDRLRRAGEPYFTEASENGHFGLGLYICSLLCRQHGGALKLVNTDSGAKACAQIKSFK